MADDDERARRTTRATTGAAKKAAAKKTAAPAKRAAVKKAAPVAKAPRPRKAVVEEAAPAKRAAPAKKAVAPAKRAAPAKKAVAAKKAAPAKRQTAAAKRAAVAKEAPPARNRGATLAPRPKKAPQMRLAAEQTFDDDWEAPEPEPVREDPHARIRSLLRNAALQVEGRAPAPTAAPRPTPAPAPPVGPEDADEPVTRVLVAPVPEEDEWLAEDDELDEAVEDEAEEEWAAPDVLEEEGDESDQMLTVSSAPTPSAPPPRNYTPPPSPPTAPPEPSPATDYTPPPFQAPAPERKADRSRLRTLVKILAAVVAVAAVVVGALWAYDNFRDEGIDYSALKVGDCFDSSASNEIRGIELKPCDQPHNSEIFFLVTHPAGPEEPYPGKDALVQFAADACLGQPLTEYLGIPLEQSKLKDFEIVPQESAWEDGKRVLVCGLDTGGEGDVTGSVRGTRR